MKKFTLLFILNLAYFIFISHEANAQVYFADPNIEQQVLFTPNVDINLDGYVEHWEAIAYTGSLDLSGYNSTDLTGIEWFTSLTSLDCSFNLLTNLDFSANSALTHLYCYNNPLSSLNISSNTALTHLVCGYSGGIVLPLDISANTALTVLSCGGIQLTNLDVSAHTALTELYCMDNILTSLNVSNNTSLTKLACDNNHLSTLDISANTALNYLNCSDNYLSSISQVPNVMSFFNISDNYIYCIPNLPEVPGANSLNANINVYNSYLLRCVPNQTSYSLGKPLCFDGDPINNPNHCPSMVNIVGNVFSDLDSNCIFNNTDWNTHNLPVKLFDTQNNLMQTSYTVNGKYGFAAMQPDSFIVKIMDFELPVVIDCGQANNQTVSLDSINQTISNINFPVLCDSAFDIKVHAVSRQGWVFPGQVHTLNTTLSNDVNWYNLNCSTVSTYAGTVTIQVVGPVTYITPAAGALTPIVSGNNFTYTIADFNSLTPTSFGLQLLTDTTAQLGNQICVHVTIATTPTDTDTTNNEYDFCYNIVNSYDPNMKEVYPTNVLPGYDDWFTYTIHFQNTGTAPAFNIRLRDTLDTQLDRSTFEFLGASHTANTSLNGNILTVRFNNIMLPDSTSDYEGSMGYYQYRVRPLPNITNGSTIENTAYIYFDYNPAIVTNTTQNNFDITVGNRVIEKYQAISIYPNPSTGIFTIKSASTIKTIEVFNLIGESVLLQTNGSNTININNQPQGIYFCKVNGNSVVKLVKE